MEKLKTLLVANRGEIAVSVLASWISYLTLPYLSYI